MPVTLLRYLQTVAQKYAVAAITLCVECREYIHCESKKLCHFYFYRNFGKYWSILKILLLLESE